MSAIEEKRWSVEEYLTFENTSRERHEFINGEIVAMTGGTPKHAKIIGYTFVTFDQQLLERNCSVTMSDLHVLVNGVRGDYAYPDLTIVCGEEVYDSLDPNALVNPNVIIEVISPSTEQYDRRQKFLLYQTIFSLQEYILIAQNAPRVERYARQPGNRWIYERYDGLNSVLDITSIGCTLRLTDVYRKLPFDGIEAL